jgi:hypothetical protein
MKNLKVFNVILNSHIGIKGACNSFGMGLKYIQYVQLHVKAICTNQEREWLMQIRTNMVHG